MPIKVRIKNAWQRLAVRFDTEEPLTSEQAYLAKTIQPITDMDKLLNLKRADDVSTWARTAAAGTGNVTAYTIPEGKRYKVYAISLVRTGGDGTLDAIWVGRTGAAVRIASQTAASGIHTELLSLPFYLDEEHRIIGSVAAISTDSTWGIAMVYEEEDAF